MITTEAWVIHSGTKPYRSALETGEFKRQPFSFPELEEDEILVEPLFGSWEGNMSHAIARHPIDICHLRQEDAVVVGNAGLVRILDPHRSSNLSAGDIGVLYGTSKSDKLGYTLEAHAYDTPRSIGLLAKQTKIRAQQFLPVPKDPRFTYQQWAAYGVKYLTAWSNWNVAYGAYRLQVTAQEDHAPHVWGWGGGSTFAELDLARRLGCTVTMISGSDTNLKLIHEAGFQGVDRRLFPHISLDEKRYREDPVYKAQYQQSEREFLQVVEEQTAGQGVAIFADYIGSPVMRVTLKALARQGVLTTAGWLMGMNTSTNRAMACLYRNIHVHTHYARLPDWHAASEFTLKTGWMPPVTEVYEWEAVDELARAAAAGKLSYFPVYAVNPV